MSGLLRFFTLFAFVSISTGAYAAGYTCPTSKKYTSCSSGYYMTKGGTYNGTPVAGNACTACPSGYTCAGGTADKKASTVTCSAGQYINGTTCKTCEAGYRCNGQTTYTPNGGVQGRTACSGSTEYQNSTGQTSCKTVSSGYYKSSNTAQSQCPSGYQVGSGAANQNSCVGNFTKTGNQLTPGTPTNCNSVTSTSACTPRSCTYKKNYAGTITSDCTPPNCTKPITGVSAKAGFYAGTNTCTACPSGYPNSDNGNTGGVTKCYSNNKSRSWSGTQTTCVLPENCATKTCNSCSGAACTYVAFSNAAGNGDGDIKSGCATNNAACQQTVATVTATDGHYISGITCPLCPAGYQDGAGATSQSGCSGNITAGHYIAVGQSSTSQPCPGGTFKGAHSVKYGSVSSCDTCLGDTYALGGAAECTACLAGYTITGDTVSDHDAATDCKINCAGGTYLATINDSTCTNVGIGYWTAASTISQGEVGVRTQCPAGLTTIGYGAGADEAGDCGRVLNIGDNKIYLRSTKKTDKSMAVGINGDVFYGNMSTDGPGALRVTSDGVTYSVYDDSML